MVYESGGIVLRRSRDEHDVVDAAGFHLVALRAAVTSGLLPLRLRPVILRNGDALLVDPRAIAEVAGHDRWFGARGCDVLPTTVALVDPERGELVLPDQDIDERVPTGRLPISTFLLREPADDGLPDAAPILAAAAVVLRDAERNLQTTLEQIDQLVRDHGERIGLHSRATITDEVKRRCPKPK